MSAPFLLPDWRFFLVAVPFLCLLAAGLLHLDASLACSRRRRSTVPAFGRDQSGRRFFTDPDGQPWYPAQRLK